MPMASKNFDDNLDNNTLYKLYIYSLIINIGYLEPYIVFIYIATNNF